MEERTHNFQKADKLEQACRRKVHHDQIISKQQGEDHKGSHNASHNGKKQGNIGQIALMQHLNRLSEDGNNTVEKPGTQRNKEINNTGDVILKNNKKQE